MPSPGTTAAPLQAGLEGFLSEMVRLSGSVKNSSPSPDLPSAAANLTQHESAVPSLAAQVPLVSSVSSSSPSSPSSPSFPLPEVAKSSLPATASGASPVPVSGVSSSVSSGAVDPLPGNRYAILRKIVPYIDFLRVAVKETKKKNGDRLAVRQDSLDSLKRASALIAGLSSRNAAATAAPAVGADQDGAGSPPFATLTPELQPSAAASSALSGSGPDESQPPEGEEKVDPLDQFAKIQQAAKQQLKLINDNDNFVQDGAEEGASRAAEAPAVLQPALIAGDTPATASVVAAATADAATMAASGEVSVLLNDPYSGAGEELKTLTLEKRRSLKEVLPLVLAAVPRRAAAGGAVAGAAAPPIPLYSEPLRQVLQKLIAARPVNYGAAGTAPPAAAGVTPPAGLSGGHAVLEQAAGARPQVFLNFSLPVHSAAANPAASVAGPEPVPESGSVSLPSAPVFPGPASGEPPAARADEGAAAAAAFESEIPEDIAADVAGQDVIPDNIPGGAEPAEYDVADDAPGDADDTESQQRDDVSLDVALPEDKVSDYAPSQAGVPEYAVPDYVPQPQQESGAALAAGSPPDLDLNTPGGSDRAAFGSPRPQQAGPGPRAGGAAPRQQLRRVEPDDFLVEVEKADPWMQAFVRAGCNQGAVFSALCSSSRAIDPGDHRHWILCVSSEFVPLLRPELVRELETKFKVAEGTPVRLEFESCQGLPPQCPRARALEAYQQALRQARGELAALPGLQEILGDFGESAQTVALELCCRTVSGS